jgi:hypothetical protein
MLVCIVLMASLANAGEHRTWTNVTTAKIDGCPCTIVVVGMKTNDGGSIRMAAGRGCGKGVKFFHYYVSPLGRTFEISRDTFTAILAANK